MEIYLDSAATSKKPERVLEAQKRYNLDIIQNINRGTGIRNFKASNLIETIRDDVSTYINSDNKDQIIFTNNCSHSINMVANSFIESKITSKSNIVVTSLEHHSNYVPWLELCKRSGAELRVSKLNKYKLDYDDLFSKIDENTLLTSVTGMSNLTGEITDLSSIIKYAKSKGSYTLVDGAQLVAHRSLNLKSFNPDFFTFSTHKMFGPFGLGILYGNFDLLKEFKPREFGGNMVSYISKNGEVHYKEIPHILELGTRNPGAIYAFKESLDYIKKVGQEKLFHKPEQLGTELNIRLQKLGGVEVYSTPGAIVSFNIKGVHPHDASDFFDRAGIVLRVGNLCASPFFMDLEESGVIRASFSHENSKEDMERVVKVVKEIKEFFL